MSDNLSLLRQRAMIREWTFTSSVPLFGRLIAALRSCIYSLTARWPLLYVAQQQTAFNSALLDVLQSDLQYPSEGVELRLQHLERELIDRDRAIIELRRDLARLELAVRELAGPVQQRVGLDKASEGTSGGDRPVNDDLTSS